MSEYINLELTIVNILSLTCYDSVDEIKEAVKSARYKENSWIGGIYDAILACREMTAHELQPVVHGRWTLFKDGSGTCSECLRLQRTGRKTHENLYQHGGGDMRDDLISRRAVLDSLVDEYNKRRQEGGLKLAWIELAVNRVGGTSVVTCGECVHCMRQYRWNAEGEPELWCDGRGWPRQMVTAEDFCSKGKKGETNG